jgi:uncharacterized membrane protein YgdD (TMEM256/DUF423 family)
MSANIGDDSRVESAFRKGAGVGSIAHAYFEPGFRWVTVGAVMMAIAVALGAFGAHALRGRLDADGERRWQTAVSWHIPHALALVLVDHAWWRPKDPDGALTLWLAGLCFAIGIVLFSGSLYVMALTGIRKLGAITPLGGLAWIVGWIFFAVAA